MTTKALITGSLSAVAQRDDLTLAESFLSADFMLIVDMSGSMGAHDAPGGIGRYEAAEQELRRLQEENPGKVGIVCFSDTTQFCPLGIPIRLNGGTNLSGALNFVKVADGTDVRFIVISDGQPDDADKALGIARSFQSRIDCVYIGPQEPGYLDGRAFLQQLAAASGGTYSQGDAPGLLADNVTRLLRATA